MRTEDFLYDLEASGRYRDIHADPIDMEAEGREVRTMTFGLMDAAGAEFRFPHDDQKLIDMTRKGWRGYWVNALDRYVVGLRPVSFPELYVLTLALSLLYRQNPDLDESSEIARALLQSVDMDLDTIGRIEGLVRGVV